MSTTLSTSGGLPITFTIFAALLACVWLFWHARRTRRETEATWTARMAAVEEGWKNLCAAQRELLDAERKAAVERIRELEAKVLARSAGELRAWMPNAPKTPPPERAKDERAKKWDPVLGTVPVTRLFSEGPKRLENGEEK